MPIITPVTGACGISLALLHELIETDVADDALLFLIQDACAAISDRIGEDGERTTTLKILASENEVYLPRPISGPDSIASIVERLQYIELTLDSTDWRWIGGRTLQRLVGNGNTNPTFWGWNFSDVDVEFELIVTYTPIPDARRTRVLVDLVKLALQANTGLQSERAGDYSYTMGTKGYQEQRVALISELIPPMRFA